MSDENLSQDELATLKARADKLGLQYHPSIGVEKLREKVAAALAGTAPDASADKSTGSSSPGPAADVPVEETLGQKRKRLKDAAMALVRVRLTCMNPGKKEWPGEIITVGNNLVGSVKKFVPFVDADEGWHIPRIMLDQLQARQCQVFVTEKSKNGITVRRGKLIKEFAIEILPQLTDSELHDLAQRQAMAKSID